MAQQPDSLVKIRPEAGSDRAAVRALNIEAFESPAEASLVDALREQANPVVSRIARHGGAHRRAHHVFAGNPRGQLELKIGAAKRNTTPHCDGCIAKCASTAVPNRRYAAGKRVGCLPRSLVRVVLPFVFLLAGCATHDLVLSSALRPALSSPEIDFRSGTFVRGWANPEIWK